MEEGDQINENAFRKTNPKSLVPRLFAMVYLPNEPILYLNLCHLRNLWFQNLKMTKRTQFKNR
jgi:hypothetical protein